MPEEQDKKHPPSYGSSSSKIGRAALSAVGGSIPFAGGLFSAAAGYWSDAEQDEVNSFLMQWVEMLREELEDKERTIIEIMARVDIHDSKIAERIKSSDYQGLIRKSFRDWSASESEEKRLIVRNILANAASTDLASDDVVRLFIDWLKTYSGMHFEVVGSIYNSSGITRLGIWKKIGRGSVREDSADADLFKMLIRDLSTGGIIRQYREVDYAGNFLNNKPRKSKGQGNVAKSAFDDLEGYELTSLGAQFVHYAMNDIPIKIEFDPSN